MLINKNKIEEYNQILLKEHQRKFEFAVSDMKNAENILQKLIAFQIAIPSWALGSGGTRFGRFSIGGEPRNLEEKMEDIGLLHALNKSSGAISLHIPWDIPKNVSHIKSLATEYDLKFDAMNSNTFQDQPDQKLSYKFGSMQHVDKAVRKQAVEHNIDSNKIWNRTRLKLAYRVAFRWLMFSGAIEFQKSIHQYFAKFAGSLFCITKRLENVCGVQSVRTKFLFNNCWRLGTIIIVHFQTW